MATSQGSEAIEFLADGRFYEPTGDRAGEFLVVFGSLLVGPTRPEPGTLVNRFFAEVRREEGGTHPLRGSSGLPATGRIPEFGVDIESVVLAQFFPDDVDQEFGVLVTPDRHVFTFVLYMGRRGDLMTQLRTSKIADWHDISGTWEASPYRRYVEEALALPDGWDE